MSGRSAPPPGGEGRRRPTVPRAPMLRMRRGPRTPAAPEVQDDVPPRDIDAVIGDCGLYVGEGRRPGKVPLAEAAEAARSDDGYVWIGLQQPTAEEFEVVARAFDLPALAVEDAVRAHQRPKLEVYGDVVFAVLKPARYVDSAEVVDLSEVSIFVGPHFVVTVRHGENTVLGRVRRELDGAGADKLAHGPAYVLYRAADLVVDGYEEVAAAITIDVEEIEAQVFGGDEHDHAERIYKLKREVLEFRRAVVPLAEPLSRLVQGQVPGIGRDISPYFRDVHDHLLRAGDAIEGHDRMLTDVLTADLAQVSVRQSRVAVRQNEDMRKISAWAAIALVPTAIAGIYGMNFDNIPELHWRYGYFIALLLMAAICFGLYRLFRRNGWL